MNARIQPDGDWFGHVVLSRDHHGKPGRNDVGAVRDIDGDGLIERREMEANLTPDYIEVARAILEQNGVAVEVVESGWYSSRHALASAKARMIPGRMAYIACHLNAYPNPELADVVNSYSTCGYDKRSGGGKKLSAAIRGVMLGHVPSDRRVISRACHTGDWTRNMLATIAGIYAGPANISAICFEPWFMDELTPENTDKFMAIAGEALAYGILRWLKACRRGGSRWTWFEVEHAACGLCWGTWLSPC